MSAPAGSPEPYTVAYSERVRQRLRELLARVAALGIEREVLDAVKALDSRLRVYPQFGEPLYDLATEGETVWTGTIDSLVAQYVIDEQRRLVFVVTPIKWLRNLGPS